jgi:hypothetical protein
MKNEHGRAERAVSDRTRSLMGKRSATVAALGVPLQRRDRLWRGRG